MTIVANLSGATQYALQAAVSAYSDEAYTNARKITGSGVMGSDPRIDTSTETFIGQMRWFTPLNPTINVASLTDSTAGTMTDFASEYAKYVKTVRTHGARKVNMQEVVSQQDGLAKVGRDFGETRAQDESDAALSVLKGVMVTELLHGASNLGGGLGLGGQTFDNDPTDKKYGFYVDLGAAKAVVDATTIIQGAARAEGFLRAVGMAYKDYEPPVMYAFISPEVYSSIRSANLVDQTKVKDGDVELETMFGGKFRLFQTRASQGLTTAQRAFFNTGGGGVDVTGTKTTFLVTAGSLAMAQLAVPAPVEMDRNPGAYLGGGTTDIWYRWGYVLHPAGYDWNGSEAAFATNAGYTAMPTANVVDSTTEGAWTRKTASALTLGILPVFHS